MRKLELSNKITVKRLVEIVFPKQKSTSINNNQKFFIVGKTKLVKELTRWEKLYINKANQNKLYELSSELQSEVNVRGVLFDKKDMEKLYNTKQKQIKKLLPRIKNPRRICYICPICEEEMDYSELSSYADRLNETIEHVLPQSKAPHFIVTPANLVITCGKCNTNDHQNISNVKTKSEINPYFDCFNIKEYLEVKLTVENNRLNPEIIFKNCSGDRDLQIKNFIIVYNLLNSYTIQVRRMYNHILASIRDQEIKDLEDLTILIEKEKQIYREYYEIDKGWIHNNYFAYVLCEKLLSQIDDIYSLIIKQANSL